MKKNFLKTNLKLFAKKLKPFFSFLQKHCNDFFCKQTKSAQMKTSSSCASHF